MGHNQRVRTNLFTVNRLEVSSLMLGGDTLVSQGKRGVLGDEVVRRKLAGEVIVEELILPGIEVDITDTGGVNGGYGAHSLLTLPDSMLVLVGIYLDLELVAATGITATAAVAVALGSDAEATGSTLTGTSADYIASANCTLVASEGDIQSTGPAAPELVNASAGTEEIFLNFGVPDAAISANSKITVSGKVRLVYIDLSQEA